MADINQGIKYTIEAEDKASTVVQKVGNEAAANVQAIEKAMAGANAVTSALQGNFTNAIASLGRFTKDFAGLGSLIAKATGWVAIIGGVVSVFQHWRQKAEELKSRLEAVRALRFDEHLKAIKQAQSDLADEVDRTISSIDKQLDSDIKSLDIIKEKTKAQIELNRQIQISGKTTEEQERINAKANADAAASERNYTASKIAAQISANAGKLDALQSLRERNAEMSDSAYAKYQNSMRAESEIYNKALDKAADRKMAAMFAKLNSTVLGSVEAASMSPDERARRRDEYKRRLRVSDEFKADLLNNADYQNALKRSEELRGVYLGAEKGVSRIDAAIQAGEEARKVLEEEKKIDEIKTKAAVQAEKNRQDKIAEVKVEATRDTSKKTALIEANAALQSASTLERSANERLAAAKAVVNQAWGWYRDKDSLKAQLDEEKVNAEAEKQFEKDFARLSFRRDWRTAKNLTVDQEAVRRVGLAREEEAAAKKAAEETAANTARAADALEEIKAAMTEEA